MVLIYRVGETAISSQSTEGRPPRVQVADSSYCHSSITSGNEDWAKSKISRVITAPFRFVIWIFSKVGLFLQNHLFCCCKFYDSDSLDWQETKDTFEEMYTAVFPEEGANFPTDRQKGFGNGFRELSPAAQERFREHIGFVLAERKGITERAQQIQWYKENRTKIKFHDDYFGNMDSQVLKDAVEAYSQELEEKTK